MWSYLGRGRKYAVIVERRVVGTSLIVVKLEVRMGGLGGGRMRSGVEGVMGLHVTTKSCR